MADAVPFTDSFPRTATLEWACRKPASGWTALSGSSHLASFDRTKCPVHNGPETADGRHPWSHRFTSDNVGPLLERLADEHPESSGDIVSP